MITGGVSVIFYEVFLSPLGGIFELYCLLPCFILSSIVILIVSLCTEPPSKKILSEFDKMLIINKKNKERKNVNNR